MTASVHQTEQPLFTVLLQLIVMAVVATIMTGPILRALLARTPYSHVRRAGFETGRAQEMI